MSGRGSSTLIPRVPEGERRFARLNGAQTVAEYIPRLASTPMEQVRRGDVFTLYQPDGTPVDGIVYIADADARFETIEGVSTVVLDCTPLT